MRADDPGAIFAEMSPRRLWTGERAECGDYNQGLLRVDQAGRVLLFEGDYECYRVPAAAVLTCTVESLGAMTTTAAYFAVVLHVRLGSGTWEFPFFPLANIEGNIHWERAMTLLGQIETMCGRSFGSPPPPPAPAQIPVGA